MKKLLTVVAAVLCVLALGGCAADDSGILVDAAALAGASPEAMAEQWGEPQDSEDLTSADGLAARLSTYYSLPLTLEGQPVDVPVVQLTFVDQGQGLALKALELDLAAAGIASTLACPEEGGLPGWFGLADALPPDTDTPQFQLWEQPTARITSLAVGLADGLVQYVIIQY